MNICERVLLVILEIKISSFYLMISHSLLRLRSLKRANNINKIAGCFLKSYGLNFFVSAKPLKLILINPSLLGLMF